MANDNIKRYLDYDGLAYLINKFNSVIEANEYTTSEALNDLNKKIAELNFNDNTGGFPIIDADITQVDSVYTTTENLNELITPGQYIVDSSKIQYEEDNFVKTLYWLLSVDKVVYDNSESIIQTYYPLSYLSYNWYNIPIGGLLQRFYEGNNTWTDLQVASPGDVDPSKFVTKNEFDTNINTINTSINNINTSINNINTSITNVNEEITDINETIKGLNKTDNDTKCTSATINVSDAPAASENEVDVIAKQQIVLTGETGESLETKQPITSVKVVTKKYVDENFTTKSEKDSIWEAVKEGIVNNISLEKSGITKVIADEDVNVPYINNKISFTEGPTGSFVGKFDVISLPTKNYVINNYVNKSTLNDYVDKASVIPNILKNGTPQADGEKDFSLQWYKTGNAITDTNSTDYNDICAPSYSDFDETSASLNKNSMVIRGFWTSSYFHDIWMSPNTDHILHRSINSGIAKPWKILLDNENCGKYIKNIIKDSVDTNQIKINNSRNIELISAPQSKLPSDSNPSNTDLGRDAGDIIFYKNVGKTYKNPDGTTNNQWPKFTGAQSGGSFTEYYGPIEIGRIYTTYDSENKCTFILRKAIGLKTEGNPQNNYVDSEIIDSNNFSNYLQQNNVITNSNISSNLPSTVITTSNISSNLPSTVITTSNIASNLPSTVITTSNISNKLPSTVITTNNISYIEFKPSSGASNGGYIDFHYGGSTVDFTSRIIEDSEGTITISASTLKVTGNINVGGGVFETSDETLKDFQDSIQVNFEQLKEIPKAYFTFKDDKTGETKIGTSAQKVKEFYPELVTENNEGILSVDYSKLSIIALKAVDELDDRITKLEKLVEQLTNK